MRQLIAGNWKMNGTAADLAELEAIARGLVELPPVCDVLICPPATLVERATATVRGRFAIGGQDCHTEPSGAFTGDIGAPMLKDAGATSVIVGHSERRQYHGETDAVICAKARAAWQAGLDAIICVGETEVLRESGSALDFCAGQLLASVPPEATAHNTAIAYEPIWAIGTGKTATVADIAEMHGHIRQTLQRCLGTQGERMRILYGGSVKPSNAEAILATANVGGALVGGASLKASDFVPIIRACTKA